MKLHQIEKAFYLMAALFLLVGCTRNDTRYFADAEQSGIAIFSSTGNNLFSCFIDGKPWRTADRRGYLLSPGLRYEISLQSESSGTTKDTLLISWEGYSGTKDTLRNYITLRLAVDQGFGYKEMNALQGQRLTINGSKDYFSNYSEFNGQNLTGSGHIYFHTLKIDSLGPGSYKGIMNGLVDADFGSSKLTNGRFDHVIEPPMIHL
jgi:hypothetical protein